MACAEFTAPNPQSPTSIIWHEQWSCDTSFEYLFTLLISFKFQVSTILTDKKTICQKDPVKMFYFTWLTKQKSQIVVIVTEVTYLISRFGMSYTFYETWNHICQLSYFLKFNQSIVKRYYQYVSKNSELFSFLKMADVTAENSY